ncbi:MAG: AMP-binding protein [Gammaproteobacteria bacterium]|nr:AMP-binding protein [Gammaproteobacteria bacterium]
MALLLVADASSTATSVLSVPLFHATGCHAIMVTCAFGGNKLVLMRRWDAGSALALIEAERINSFGGVPAVPWQILEHPALNATDTSSVEAIGYGGVPAAPELVKRIAQAFPAVSPGNGWGLTETSAVTTQNSGIDYAQRPDSVGVPVPVCDVVVGDPHAPLPPENAGELWVRGPNVVREYWGNPQATAHAFVDGWFRTGDIGRIDADGFVYILDRAKDMLIRGGENICCVEVENALYEHPEVMDAAVVGVPHRVLGEEVGAVVQRVPGGTLSAEKLKAFVSERLAHFKVPVAVEFTMDPLPRNANGKILKQTLRDVFRGHNVG